MLAITRGPFYVTPHPERSFAVLSVSFSNTVLRTHLFIHQDIWPFDFSGAHKTFASLLPRERLSAVELSASLNPHGPRAVRHAQRVRKLPQQLDEEALSQWRLTKDPSTPGLGEIRVQAGDGRAVKVPRSAVLLRLPMGRRGCVSHGRGARDEGESAAPASRYLPRASRAKRMLLTPVSRALTPLARHSRALGGGVPRSATRVCDGRLIRRREHVLGRATHDKGELPAGPGHHSHARRGVSVTTSPPAPFGE